MKKCPFCAEEIQDKATMCPYCRETLSIAPPATEGKRGGQFWLSRIADWLWMTTRRVAKMSVISLGVLAAIGLVATVLEGEKEPSKQKRGAGRSPLTPEAVRPSQREESSQGRAEAVPEPEVPGQAEQASAGPPASTPEPTTLEPQKPSTTPASSAEKTTEPTSASAENKKDVLTYRTLGIADLGWDEVVRLKYRIRVSREPTEGELRAICNPIIDRQKQRKPHNALSFLFYLPGTETDPCVLFSAGKAEWAPDGVWGTAGTVKAGDYSRHKLVVNCGSAARETSPKPSEPTYDFKAARSVPKAPSWQELLSPRRPPSKPSYIVRYIVSFGSAFGPGCGGKAFVSYENDQGGTEQAQVEVDSLRAGAWEKSLFFVKRGVFLYLSAQNQGGGEIRTTISVDGHVWKTSMSSGAYAIASCSGFIGLE